MSDPVLSPASKQTSGFEFTKRKRWQDLLSAELADAVVLVLSAARRVLHCGSAISEILGWDGEELIDCDLLDFIPPAERAGFRCRFEEHMRTDAKFVSFTYLNTKDGVPVSAEYQTGAYPRAVLFELSGHRLPVPAPDEEALCFLVAKPYPGRNTEALNHFVALKIDHERLLQRLTELRMQSALAPSTNASVPHASQYASTSMSTSAPLQTDALNPFYRAPGMYDRDNGLQSPTTMTRFENGMGDGQRASGSSCKAPDDDNGTGEEGSRRKKARRSLMLDQFVCITCGRTDSPEWRKGPLGPKTLCNACGLRWAKQMRKTEDTGESAEP